MTAVAGGTAEARERAGHIVADLASRLADPARVTAAVSAPENTEEVAGPSATPWTPPSLSEGNTGVALLFAELSRSQPAHAEPSPCAAPSTTTPSITTPPELRRHLAAAHAHLTAAAAHPVATAPGGLFQGATSLAFAARTAAGTRRDYAVLLEHLDPFVTTHLDQLLTAEEERLAAARPGVSLQAYDAINGVAGLARYLLLRRPRPHDALARALAYLVRLTEPVTAHGRRVPGWWVPRGTGLADQDPDYPRGHFNLGLAHGIPGPLALLALAWQAGERVADQDLAIARIVAWLLRWRTAERQWPSVISWEQHTEPAHTPPYPGRVAWCYGTPGVARALYLAGRALDRPDWQGCAVEALAHAIDEGRGLIDCSLCHGWAGVLHTTWRMVHDSGDPALADRLPRLVAPVLAAYDPQLPFGFRYATPRAAPVRGAEHRAGFLAGAAGIALALHTYATGHPPATGWDGALLLS